MSNSAASLKALRAHEQLFLLFSMGADRYALDVREVVEVLPLRRFKQIPEAPAWVAGLFSYRGQLVPVLDLSAQAFGTSAVTRTSTRLVLVHYRSHCLGLILEQATNTLRCDPQAFHESGLDNVQARYLGPVYKGKEGLVQRVRIEDLLTDDIRDLLFPSGAR